MTGAPTGPLDAELAAVPPPPRTASARAQKLLLGFRGTTRAMLIIGAACSAIGLPVLLVVLPGVVSNLLIDCSGETIEGTVVQVATDAEHSRYGREKVEGDPALAITFRYEVDGEEHTGEVLTHDMTAFGGLQQGATVPVEYSSLAEGIARVEGTSRNIHGLLGFAVLLFPLIGPLLLRSALRHRSRRRRAYVGGVACVAWVEFWGEDTSVSTGRQHPTVVRYRFEVGGEEHTGSFSDLEPATLEPFHREQIIVLFDPDRPQDSVPYLP